MKIRPRARIMGDRVYHDFVVDLGMVEGEDGERRRRTRAFASSEEAELFLEATKGLRRRHGDAAVSLPPETALRYAAIEDRLGAAGVTIEQVADCALLEFCHHQLGHAMLEIATGFSGLAVVRDDLAPETLFIGSIAATGVAGEEVRFLCPAIVGDEAGHVVLKSHAERAEAPRDDVVRLAGDADGVL